MRAGGNCPEDLRALTLRGETRSISHMYFWVSSIAHIARFGDTKAKRLAAACELGRKTIMETMASIDFRRFADERFGDRATDVAKAMMWVAADRSIDNEVAPNSLWLGAAAERPPTRPHGAVRPATLDGPSNAKLSR